MASWAGTSAAVAEPQVDPRGPARPRPQTRRKAQSKRTVRGGVVWIVVLAVLRLNVQLDKLGGEKVDLRSQNAELQSELSSALAAPRIQALARQQLGLVPASPDATQYIQLGPGR